MAPALEMARALEMAPAPETAPAPEMAPAPETARARETAPARETNFLAGPALETNFLMAPATEMMAHSSNAKISSHNRKSLLGKTGLAGTKLAKGSPETECPTNCVLTGLWSTRTACYWERLLDSTVHQYQMPEFI